MKTQNYKATDTFRERRLKHCLLIDRYEDDEKEDKRYEYRSEGKIEAVEWNDNSVVTLYSNDTDVEPFTKVKRRVKERVICM